MLLTVVIFIIILSILVFIHELGHFTMARLIGVNVEEFGFGLPPRIWGKKFKKTIYSINWLPIGGFVKLSGEDDSEEKPKLADRSQYFFARSKKERAVILLAGVTMNFIIGSAITSYLLVGGLAVPAGAVNIVKVQPDSPASQANLRPLDVVESVSYTDKEGSSVVKPLSTVQELKSSLINNAGKPVVLHVVRDEKRIATTITPREKWPEGSGPVGIEINDLKVLKYPWWQAPWEGFVLSLQRIWQMLAGIGTIFVRLANFQSVGQDVAGPIGIAQVTHIVIQIGWRALLEFVSILSLNLAVLNILPIPALDGGRLAFIFLEKIIGRKVKPAFEQSTHQIGMIILFILILLISINDILRLTNGG